MDVFGLMGGCEVELSVHSRAALARSGLSLSRQQLARIDATRRTALAECERVEFAPGFVDVLVLAFADSPFLGQADVCLALSGAVELFYAVRDDAPADVPDDEVLAAVREAFDAVEGGVDVIDASSLACELATRELQLTCEEHDGGVGGEHSRESYSIVDDEGRVYRWSAGWEYDEFSPGWDGERWDDDLD